VTAEAERQRLEVMREEAEAKLAGKSMDKEVKEMREALRNRDAAKIMYDEADALFRNKESAANKEVAEAEEAMTALLERKAAGKFVTDKEVNKARREQEEADFAVSQLTVPRGELDWATNNYEECLAAYEKELREADEAKIEAAREIQEASDLKLITEAKIEFDKRTKVRDSAVRTRTR